MSVPSVISDLSKALVSITATFTLLVSVAEAEPDIKLGTTAIFPVGGEVAAYDADEKVLKFLELKAGSLTERNRIKVPGNVWGVTEVPGGYAVATGLGRGDIEAPLRVHWFSKDGKSSRNIFERVGERTQLTYLNFVDGKLWATFFESKYMTKTGYFTERADGSWSFKELWTHRLGDAVGVLGDYVAIGRPYGDVQGQDGDLRLYSGSLHQELPSYRGVRAVRLFGDKASPSIAIGDGWHQSYAQFGQGRVSLLEKDPKTGRYALQLLDRDPGQYAFSELADFSLGGKSYIAALGNKSLAIYGPSPAWAKKVIYTRPAEDTLYDLVFLKTEGNKAWFAVLDREVKVVTFEG